MKSDFELKLPNLNLNDLLRSGFAGAFFILVAVTAFNDPGQLLKNNKDVAGALVALGVPVSLTIGTVIYAFHRAIPFVLLYGLLSAIVYENKVEILHLDIARWKRSMKKEDSLQDRFTDWASQIHFLYCLSWASFSALYLGNLFLWKQASTYCVARQLSLFFMGSAVIHHYRYLCWEYWVFQGDSSSMALEPSQSDGNN